MSLLYYINAMKEFSLEEKYRLIKNDIVNIKYKNPIETVKEMMKKDYISIHGPEHHFLDGAAFIVAYGNAVGETDIFRYLDEFERRTTKMPGGMCAYWGICGAAASVGAALSVIHGTSPLSTDEFYKDNLKYTSSVLAKMSEIGGARCCKRNAFLALSYGVKFVRENYDIDMETSDIVCEFSHFNKQCLKNKCPFYKKSR